MFSIIQILLLVVVLVLTALAVVIGVQVFKLIKQLRQIADNINQPAENDNQPDLLAQLVKVNKLSENQEEKDRARSSSSRSFYRNGRSLS